MKKHIYILTSLIALLWLGGTLAHAQVKIGANPGTIGSSSNLEVEATNGNKTVVNKATGQLTIQDGTQGAGKILTSDANGGSSWVAPKSGKLILGTLPDNQTTPLTLPNNMAKVNLGASITLPPGKWMVHVGLAFFNPSTTAQVNLQVYLSTSPTGAGGAPIAGGVGVGGLPISLTNPVAPGFMTGEVVLPQQQTRVYPPPQVIEVATTTTFYLIGFNFSGGNTAVPNGQVSISRNISGTSAFFAQSLDI